MVILKQDITEKQAMFYLLAYSFLRKKSSDYKTIQLTPKEYAHVMSEIATWATE